MLELIAARDWRAGLAENIADFYRLIDRSPALQARARLMSDLATAHLAVTIADQLAIPSDDIVAVATAATLTAIRNSLLGQARRESFAGTPVETIAKRLAIATARAFALLDTELTTLGAPRATLERQPTRARDGVSGAAADQSHGSDAP